MNKWENQQEANITAFLEDDEEHLLKRNFFFKMYKAFEKEGIKWTLFCSSSLFFAGITDMFNDFDLLIDKESFEDAKGVLKQLKMKVVREEICGLQINDVAISKEEMAILEKVLVSNKNWNFSSNRYLNAINKFGVKVDAISGFRVAAMDMQYLYEYNPLYVKDVHVGDVTISIVCPEVQFILYSKMECWQPERKFKRKLLQEYIQDRGIHHPEILEEALRQRVPGWVKKEIRRLLIS